MLTLDPSLENLKRQRHHSTHTKGGEARSLRHAVAPSGGVCAIHILYLTRTCTSADYLSFFSSRCQLQVDEGEIKKAEGTRDARLNLLLLASNYDKHSDMEPYDFDTVEEPVVPRGEPPHPDEVAEIVEQAKRRSAAPPAAAALADAPAVPRASPPPIAPTTPANRATAATSPVPPPTALAAPSAAPFAAPSAAPFAAPSAAPSARGAPELHASLETLEGLEPPEPSSPSQPMTMESPGAPALTSSPAELSSPPVAEFEALVAAAPLVEGSFGTAAVAAAASAPEVSEVAEGLPAPTGAPVAPNGMEIGVPSAAPAPKEAPAAVRQKPTLRAPIAASSAATGSDTGALAASLDGLSSPAPLTPTLEPSTGGKVVTPSFARLGGETPTAAGRASRVSQARLQRAQERGQQQSQRETPGRMAAAPGSASIPVGV